MTLNGWNAYGEGSNYTLDDTESAEGNASLSYGNNNNLNPGALILPVSESDSPTEATVETFVRPDGSSGAAGGMVARHQGTGNFYYVLLGYSFDTDSFAVAYGKYIDGSENLIGTSGFSRTLPDGNDAYGLWFPARFSLWNSGGSLFARVEVDDGQDGTFDQVGSDISDDNPSFTEGGGVGIGGGYSNANGGNFRVDQTEVYY